jgi:hypothetical protein
MKIEVDASAELLRYTVDNRSVGSANIADYQHGVSVTRDDIFIGTQSVFVRLGRENDMFLISAFNHDGYNTCSKHLYCRLRDGQQIAPEFLGPDGGRDLYV